MGKNRSNEWAQSLDLYIFKYVKKIIDKMVNCDIPTSINQTIQTNKQTKVTLNE